MGGIYWKGRTHAPSIVGPASRQTPHRPIHTIPALFATMGTWSSANGTNNNNNSNNTNNPFVEAFSSPPPTSNTGSIVVANNGLRTAVGNGWRQRCVVHETPACVTLAEGFIQREIARKQWIYDVIDGEREADKVLYNSDEFMILPDADAQNVAGRILNWLVIFKDRSLRSVRDLRGGENGHLPLLRRVHQTLRQLLLSSQDDTMLYFHCPPSVWQLHLHVAFPCDVLRTTNDMQKVQFLDDVISNLEIDPEFYRKATLTYVLPIGHELIRLYAPSSTTTTITHPEGDEILTSSSSSCTTTRPYVSKEQQREAYDEQQEEIRSISSSSSSCSSSSSSPDPIILPARPALPPVQVTRRMALQQRQADPVRGARRPLHGRSRPHGLV